MDAAWELPLQTGRMTYEAFWLMISKLYYYCINEPLLRIMYIREPWTLHTSHPSIHLGLYNSTLTLFSCT